MPNDLPLISVVTPSLNQGEFLETTLFSVLGQCYPRLEYIVMDGGSTDGSLDIIHRHASSLSYWVSQPDGGQAAALNAGFARATGDILCWLNSDDFFLPGTLHAVAKSLTDTDDLIYGDCLSFTQRGEGSKLHRPPAFDRELLGISDYIVQPSAFWRRSLWEETGPLNEHLHYAFDWEWFLRATGAGRFRKIDGIFSAYRFHDGHKSSSGGEKRRAEVLDVGRSHGGDNARAHYDFTIRHLDSLKRCERLRLGIAGRGIRQNAPVARAFFPQFWSLPREVTWSGVQLCLSMLG